MERILLPERARKDALPFDASRRALHLVLRLQPRRAPEHLARVMRDPGLTFILRMHAATLGRRTCAGPLGPVFREVYAAEKREGGLAANLLRGIAASGGADAGPILSAAMVAAGPQGPPPEVRLSAAEALDERPTLRDPRAIARALAAETDAGVLLPLMRVAAASLGDGAARAVAPFLRDRRVRVRRAAAGALSLCPGPESTGFLLAAIVLEDGDDDRLPWYGPAGPTDSQRQELRGVRVAHAGSVRGAAVSSLRIAAGAGAPALLARLLESSDPEIRAAAADNLFNLGDEGAAPALESRILREKEAGLRDRFLTILAALGGPAADAAFGRMLASEDEDVRVTALRALSGERAKSLAPEGARQCIERSGAGSEERLAAVLAYGRSRAPGAAAILAAMLEGTPAGEERRTILQALGLTRDPAAVPAVAALLPGGPAGMRAPAEDETSDLAVEVLGELRAAAATGPLADLLRRALPVALEALVAAALDRGFSRAAEAATADPLLRRPLRREDERWRAEIPDDLRETGLKLAAALARWKDADLVPALRRRLEALSRDGSASALSEEWLVWLGTALAEPSAKTPNRPRWWSRVLLLRQAVANPPRMSEPDGAAFDALFLHESDVAGEYAAARRSLDAARACRRLHDPVRADREERLFAALGMVVDAAEALRTSGDGAAAAEAFDRAFAAGKEDRVARLVVEVLGDMKKEPALALRFGELAVRSEGNGSNYWPNLRALGAARLGAGDAAGAAEAYAAAVREQDAGGREPARESAWNRVFLARALAALGKRDEALAAIGQAAPLNDVVLDWIERDPAFESLRADGRLDAALDPARRKFEE
jgi:HEAT repeat protein/tetratricopeptide (TPR) repeat protein